MNLNWSAIDFWKTEFEKSSWMNLIFSLHTLNLNFAGYTGIKSQVWNRHIGNQVHQTWFFKFDFSKINWRSIGGDQIHYNLCCCSLLFLSFLPIRKSFVNFAQKCVSNCDHLWCAFSVSSLYCVEKWIGIWCYKIYWYK